MKDTVRSGVRDSGSRNNFFQSQRFVCGTEAVQQIDGPCNNRNPILINLPRHFWSRAVTFDLHSQSPKSQFSSIAASAFTSLKDSKGHCMTARNPPQLPVRVSIALQSCFVFFHISALVQFKGAHPGWEGSYRVPERPTRGKPRGIVGASERWAKMCRTPGP